MTSCQRKPSPALEKRKPTKGMALPFEGVLILGRPSVREKKSMCNAGREREVETGWTSQVGRSWGVSAGLREVQEGVISRLTTGKSTLGGGGCSFRLFPP